MGLFKVSFYVKFYFYFKSSIKHFSIYFLFLKEYAGEDLDDLYLEEREQTITRAQDEKRKQQLAVPGIVGPHEVPEEMQD